MGSGERGASKLLVYRGKNTMSTKMCFKVMTFSLGSVDKKVQRLALPYARFNPKSAHYHDGKIWVAALIEIPYYAWCAPVPNPPSRCEVEFYIFSDGETLLPDEGLSYLETVWVEGLVPRHIYYRSYSF